MKRYKKNKENYFVCEECGVLYKGMNNFSRHVGKYHGKKFYFDKWIKENDDNKCKICGNKTLFSGKLNLGYNKFCSKKCANKSNRIGFEKGMMKKYGTIIPMRIKKSREKYVKTMIHQYGVAVPSQNKKISNKILRSMNKKYGGNAPVQNVDIFNKSFRKRIKIYHYKNTKLSYQGLFELDFLEKFVNKIDIINGPRIKYVSKDGIKRVYYSDFYIPSLNLIVEIKSSFILTLDPDIFEKKLATIKNGYKYILILDKNYNEFNNLIKNL
jgi:uncharacterized C2H2 Zn-finger protein